MNNVPAAPANLAATYICCEHPPINPALLCPFSVGEIIARSDRLEMDGCKVKPLSFRPFGKLSIEGDARSALPAVLAWIDDQAVLASGRLWQEVISENLLAGRIVNVEKLPAGVVRSRLT